LNRTISIIMPAYKAEATLAGAVQSLMMQSFSNWQLLLIADDGADYESVLGALGLADRRIRYLSSGGVGTGASATRNAGLAACETRFAALLDADDRMASDKLDRFNTAFGEHAIVSTAIQVTDAALRPLRQVGAGADRVLTAGQHKWVNLSMDSMIGWDRQKTDARFDPTLPNMNDLDFLMRLYAGSATSLHLGAPLHLYVKQPSSLSNGAGMTERMIAAKTVIRQRLAAGYYPFADPGATAGFDAFLAISLEAERRYPAALQARPGLLFEDHIEPLLKAARPG